MQDQTGSIENVTTKHPFPRFALGRVVATPAALEILGPLNPYSLIRRHVQGDWSEMDDFDRKQNEAAAASYDSDKQEMEDRILSAYTINGEKVWVITEWDCSATTVLLPSDY